MSSGDFEAYSANFANAGLLPEEIKEKAGRAISKYSKYIMNGSKDCGGDQQCINDLIIDMAQQRVRDIQRIQ